MAYIHVFSMITMIISVVWLAMRANKNKTTYSFMICQSLLIIWSMAKLTEMQCSNDLNLYFCYALGNIGVCFIGTSWAAFSCEYRCVKKYTKFIKSMYMVSAINYIASLTNPLHRLYYTSLSLGNFDHGIIFYENVAVTYICIIFGVINLCKKTFGEGKHSRGQAIFVALSVLIPMCLNVVYISGVLPFSFDTTPIGFTASSIFIIFAVYKYDFLDVNTMTLSKISGNISEGIIVCNIKGEITYINSIAELFFSDCENMNSVISKISDPQIMDISIPDAQAEVTISDTRLNVRRYNCSGKNNKIMTVAFIISDVSKYYSLIEKTRLLAAANEEVAVEKERNRLAQEIHDTVGHTLTMVNSLSRIIKINYTSQIGDAEKYVDEIMSVASSGITQLRMAVNNIRHCSTSIISGVSSILKAVRDTETELCIQGEESDKYLFCSSAVCDCLRETITNCLRYSGASRIDVIIKFLESSFEIYIFDNGVGCDEIKEGNGISGIKKKIEEIGGNVSFVSSSENGFTTIIRIPTGG